LATAESTPVHPRVYLACVCCYNRGRLHGAWFDVETDPEALRQEVTLVFAPGCQTTCDDHDPEGPECVAHATPFDSGATARPCFGCNPPLTSTALQSLSKR